MEKQVLGWWLRKKPVVSRRWISEELRMGDLSRVDPCGEESGIIVTYNKGHFEGVEQFGIRVLTAQEILKAIGELP